MEKIAAFPFIDRIKTYLLLTKPGIIMGNAMTAAGGFALASEGSFNLPLFFAMLAGLSCIIGSACIFNNYIDRDADQKMTRTQKRALAIGLIPASNAMIFALILMLLGAFLLIAFTPLLAAAIALFGLFVYVLLYSFAKYRTMHATLIGSIAGAVPPVVGYCAASSHFDLGALILFIMIALWQMPHFFAIAIYRLDDYAKASIPLLPIVKGIPATKIHMLIYTCAFAIASCMPTFFKYTGYLYLTIAALLGIAWLLLCLKGFTCTDDKRWARKMFLFSLIIVTVLCLAIPFSKI